MQMQGIPADSSTILTRYGGGKLHVVIGIGSQHTFEDLIQWLNDGGNRAKVCRELQRRQREMRCSCLHSSVAHLVEQSRFRVAEKIDRLHRVSDKKAGPAIAGVPILKKSTQKGEVRSRRILKFVDEQVLNAFFQSHQHIGALERRLSRDSRLREIDDVLLGEDHAQLGNGMAKHDEDAAYGRPLLLAVGAGWQLSQFAELRE